MAVNAQRSFHVVTYVVRQAADGAKVEDVAAHGKLAVVADPKQKIDGDSTKAILSRTQNHQCDGSKACEGCNQLHANAEERVVTRLAPNNDVRVVWRKYHPLIAQGLAQPGKPFEFDAGDVKVRVEAREIVDKKVEEITDTTISVVSMRKLEAELKTRAARADVRRALLQAFRNFEAQHWEPQRQALEQKRAAMANLPDQAAAQATFDAAFAALDAAKAALLPAIDVVVAADQDVRASQLAFTQHVNAAVASLPPAAQDVTRLERAFQALIAFQKQVRGLQDVAQKMVVDAAGKQMELPTLDLEDVGLTVLATDVDALLDATQKDDALAQLGAHNATFAALQKRSEVVAAAYKQALVQPEADRAAFEARKKRVQAVHDGAILATYEDFIGAGASLAGFAVQHWLAEAKKTIAGLQAPDVSGLTYDKDEASLVKAEATLAALTAFDARLNAEMKKRAGLLYSPFDWQGKPCIAPTIRVKSTPDDKGQITVEVTLQSNSQQAVGVSLLLDGNVVASTALPARGTVVKTRFTCAPGALSADICGIGDGIAAAHAGTDVTLVKAAVPSVALDLDGSVQDRTFLPYHFTPAPEQPRGNIRLRFVPQGGQDWRRDVPGL